MPSMNTIKKYLSGGLYHIYNRANNRAYLFEKPSDYKFFIGKIGSLLDAQDNSFVFQKNFHNKIKIFSFCLMPTHFHFLLSQSGQDDVAKFMQSLQLSYSLYRKKKTGFRGRLYESRYKARLLSSEGDFINVSKYIHNNPKELGCDIFSYPYSSLRAYSNYGSKEYKLLRFLDMTQIMRYFSDDRDSYCSYVK